MAINYDLYRIFYHVGKHHSFTRAAKVLFNSQPNITRAMNELEHQLGCRLFFRSRKGAELTPEGEKLFLHVQAAFAQLEAGEAEIASQKGLCQGTLSIGASEIALHLLLLPILRRFKQQYPGIRICITNHSTFQAVAALQSGAVELAVVTSPTDAAAPLRETPLLTVQDILIAGPAFGALAAQPLTPAELAAQPLICLGRGTSTFRFYERFFAAHGQPLSIDVEAATADQILPLAMHDLGLAFLPEQFARSALERGQVVQLSLTEELPCRQICLVRDSASPQSAAARAFADMLLSGSRA